MCFFEFIGLPFDIAFVLIVFVIFYVFSSFSYFVFYDVFIRSALLFLGFVS